MNVYVEFELDDDRVTEQLKDLGYQVFEAPGGNRIRKNTHIKSVINEIVPIVEKAGINAWNLHIKEYRGENAQLVSEYREGRIKSYS